MLTVPSRTLRRDALRWGLCFAVVAAAHAAAVVALLPTPPSESDFVAGAPVAMIELPEAPAALSNPPTDLLPGPAEPDSEQTPAKEEMKPPEEVAEVTLPEPQPPKPEPPSEERPATAPPSVAAAMPAPPTIGAETQPVSDAVLRWESALAAHIERFKRYPPEARARGRRGSARVAFTIERDGRLRDSHIIKSSGSQELDRETLAMLTRAQPMPKPPGDVQTVDLSRAVTVQFDIK
jgi:periplasmic protein TonB